MMNRIATEVAKNAINDHSVIILFSSNGVPFLCRTLTEGTRYGRDLALIHDDAPVIEYHDARYPHTKYGQFVSRYFLETLQQHVENKRGGLDLCGHEPLWKLDTDAFIRSVCWAEKKIASTLAHQ